MGSCLSGTGNGQMKTLTNVVLTEKLDTQGGGHGRIIKCTVDGEPGIAKPLDHIEKDAYLAISRTPLASSIPKLFGSFVSEGTEYVVIEDLTFGFKSPSVADFKVGTRTWDPDATDEKKNGLIEKQKGSTTDSLGVRIIDLKIKKNGEVTKQVKKADGLKLSQDDYRQQLKDFVPEKLKSGYNSQVKDIKCQFEKTLKKFPGFRIYASSLLVLYDGDSPTSIRTKIIDLAHCHLDINTEYGVSNSDKEYDDGVIKGLENLIIP
uniref:Kinase n=1 Tax=Coptotermes formosanus TaxID=36987 RepID=R4V1B9_COPFO|nr:inositol polyphosphate kinase family protein [Coptotermes formosanus]